MIAEKLGCSVFDLKTRLSDPENLLHINTWLANQRVITLYKNQGNRYKELPFHYIVPQSASYLPAYGIKVRGVTVEQHYHSRHRIQLLRPHNPCLAHYFHKNLYYYPLELMALFPWDRASPSLGVRSFQFLEQRHFTFETQYEVYLDWEKNRKIGKILDMRSITT